MARRGKRTKLEMILRAIELVKEGKLDAHPLFLQTEIDELLLICNGCGAADSKLPVPDTIWGLWVGPGCCLHDFEYHIGETQAAKELADRRMLSNNLMAIEACSTWILKPPRRQRAMTYYAAVTDFGHDAFWANKEEKTDDES